MKILILAKNNLPVLLKELFLSFVIISVFLALIAVSLNIPIDGEGTAGINGAANGVISEFFSSDGTLSGLQSALFDFEAKFQEIFPNRFGVFYQYPSLSLLIIIVAVFLWKFLNGLSDLPTLHSVNDFMTTGQRRHFSWHYIKCFGKSCLFQLSYLCVTFSLDIVAIFAVVGSYSLLFIHLGLYGAIGGLLFFAVIYSLRLSLFSYWSIALVADGMKIRGSLGHSVCVLVNNFRQNFLFTLITISLTFSAAFASLYYLDNIYGLITISVCGNIAYYLIKCMNLAYYYNSSKKPYFTYKMEIKDE